MGAYFQGLSFGIIRQLSFASLRIGLFDYALKMRQQQKGQELNLIDRISLAVATGGIAICVANPVDVLKV